MSCRGSNTNGAWFYETLKQRKSINISYPKTLRLIRRMKTLSPTEEKTKPQKNSKCKPNFPLHVCKNQHVLFNFYIEINPKDNDQF